MRVSILDLGSNSFRLLVADVTSEGAIRPVLRAREFLRLGSEVVANKSLADDVVERAVGATAHLAGLGRRTGAERSIAVATSAIRDAANGAEIVDRLRSYSTSMVAASNSPSDQAQDRSGPTRWISASRGCGRSVWKAIR